MESHDGRGRKEYFLQSGEEDVKAGIVFMVVK
jgi:hypothetical protein